MSTSPSLALIDLRAWRQFVAVAEELHFGRAAQRLCMTQPPLTHAIAQLEATVGARLFDRSKRSVQLSATGRTLLPHAIDLLQRATELQALAHSAAEGSAGRLKLAFVSTVGFDVLPQWVMAFRQACPLVQLELVEATGDVQLLGMERGEFDAGFLLHAPGFAPVGLAGLILNTDSLVLAMPEQHPLAQAPVVQLTDMLATPLVMFPRRIVPSLYDAVFGMYHAAGLLPAVAQEAIQMQTIVNLVSAGLGVAWVPASVRQFQRPGVVYRQVVGAVAQCQTSLVWPHSSPVLSRFLEFAPPGASLHKLGA
ncbi:LysR family transcriptional regulator [Rhodoferax aquaticus]|uniref:LysR family transcriptional regulator n=1 Tax=Rhodoferax aquaticus TaxID=2527691 RepID=A0A515EQF1_9BURK|nr:LysR family transcriptional regulator [Rhodoferax aquaticus]QDL54835.1 LysR family transcriptional regulator [Rhodoferax aquaticus]